MKNTENDSGSAVATSDSTFVTIDKSSGAKTKRKNPRINTNSERINIRCSPDLKIKLEAKAQKAEKSLSEFMLNSAGNISIYVTQDNELKQLLREKAVLLTALHSDLNRINANLNMLAKHANIYQENTSALLITTGLVSIERDLSKLNEFIKMEVGQC